MPSCEIQASILEPKNGLIGILSGGAYALAAARKLRIAARICVYANESFKFITLENIDGSGAT